MKKLFLATLFITMLFYKGHGQEEIFANYFDIAINQSAGTQVTGRINLKSNKDVYSSPIPNSYAYSIASGNSLFTITTERDAKGHLFGVLKVASGQNTGSTPKTENLTVELKNGNTLINTIPITVHIVNETDLDKFITYYESYSIQNSRMYGRTTRTDSEIASIISHINANNGALPGVLLYTYSPADYASSSDLYEDWITNAAGTIGAMGYAYVNSSTHAGSTALKEALYKALQAIADNIPVDGDDVLVNGQPLGTELGDGFGLLSNEGYASHSLLTHQWEFFDPFGAAIANIWRDVITEMQAGDADAKNLYESINHMYEGFFSIVESRRVMDDPTQRWGDISNQDYSLGAWSDANIHHRMRTMMLMPVIRGDYNMPMTYVPYWYDDYFDGTQFDGKSFAKNYTPKGVVLDLQHWAGLNTIPTKLYGQSGFHPDGSVTHHTGHGTSDAAMFAYGYEWLVGVKDPAKMLKDTQYTLEEDIYEFITDRLLYSYSRLVFKDNLDWVMTGRSFGSSSNNIFGTKILKRDITSILDAMPANYTLSGKLTDLNTFHTAMTNNTHTFSGSATFWNADYVMSRKESGNDQYMFSVKNKSTRTTGAEDFNNIRRSWHAGSGVFLLRTQAADYSSETLERYDWHVVPGVTEAWASGPLPTGAASLAGAGNNEFSGQVNNDEYAISGYYHDSQDDFTVAKAQKSYFIHNNQGTAVGNQIELKEGANNTNEIVTTIDQNKFTSTLTYFDGATSSTISAGANTSRTVSFSDAGWVHHGDKGYLIFPASGQNLLIKTGDQIAITSTEYGHTNSENFILALDHGTSPNTGAKDKYHYVAIANATAAEMPSILASYTANNTIVTTNTTHGIRLNDKSISENTFFAADRINYSENEWVEASAPCVAIVEEKALGFQISVADAMHNLATNSISIKIPHLLTAGTYTVSLPGIQPTTGETATVTSNGTISTITFNTANQGDFALYNYQEKMYAGAPLTVFVNTVDQQEQTVTLTAIEDASTIGDEPTTPSNYSNISVRSSIDKNMLVKFDISNLSGAVSDAKVRLYLNESVANTVVGAYIVNDDTWDEATVTYSTSPTVGAKISEVALDDIGKYYEWDVTSHLRTQNDNYVTIAFADESGANANQKFDSRTRTNKPELVVTTVNNIMPVVSITAPADDAIFDEAADITITATANDDNGSITNVEFFIDEESVGQDSTAPYEITVNNLDLGKHAITAVATDNDGAVSTTDPTTITVNPPPVEEIVTLIAVEDASPRGTDPTSPGNYSNISVRASIDKYTLVKFDISNLLGTVTNAKARLYLNETAGNTTIGAFVVANDSWDEATVTDNNGPTIGAKLSEVAINTAGMYYEWDVTSHLQNQQDDYITIAFVDETGSSDDQKFDSRTKTNKPELVVTADVIRIPENQAPEVSITEPTDNTVFSIDDSVNVTATANDSDGSIAKVAFFVNGQYINEDLTAPYQSNITGLALGNYTLTAVATDNDGATTTSTEVNVLINAAPSVSITSPVENYVYEEGDAIVINANASDTDGTIASVAFFVDGQSVGTATANPFETTATGLNPGNYTLTAVATDNHGATTTSAEVNVLINAAPSVSITSPADNYVYEEGDAIVINANASDADGTIASVAFFVDGQSIGTATASPFETSASGLTPGNYTLTAVATDNHGATTTSAVVNVLINAAPSVSITSPTDNQEFEEGDTVVINANASDTDGTIISVEFFVDGQSTGTDTVSPFETSASGLTPGNYTLTAVATDNNGTTTTASEVSITINAAPIVTTTTITSIEDASPNASKPDNVYNNSNLAVRSSIDKLTIVKFDISNIAGNISNAKVKLYLNESAGSTIVGAYGVTDDTWSESTMTYNTIPTINSLLSTVTLNNVGAYYEWDVTSHVSAQQDGIVSIAFDDVTGSSFNQKFDSRTKTNKPTLVIEHTISAKFSSEKEIQTTKENDKFSVYPNPALNTLYINSNTIITQGEIYSPTGLLLMRFTGNQIDITNLKPGMYLLKTNEHREFFVKK